MTAFVISRVEVRDREKMQEYAVRAAETIAAHGGELVLRGGFRLALLGEDGPHAAALIRFPDMAAVEAWFSCPSYRALAGLRDAACSMRLIAYEAAD